MPAPRRTPAAWDGSVYAALSVNNVMLWDRPTGFAEMSRVLSPGGQLVITVHRHVLDVAPEQLAREATVAGFAAVRVNIRPRKRNSPAVELVAIR